MLLDVPVGKIGAKLSREIQKNSTVMFLFLFSVLESFLFIDCSIEKQYTAITKEEEIAPSIGKYNLLFISIMRGLADLVVSETVSLS